MIKKKVGHTVVELIEGDITRMETDAIVNAANSQLAHGGGVSGAILKRGGPVIQEESNTWVFARGPIPVGEVAITSGGNLTARYVIHAVGPRMGEGNEDEKLRKATLNSLIMADKHKLESIAFPAISTGIFGYPLDRCAVIMLNLTFDYLLGETNLERVIFCLYDEKSYKNFQNTMKNLKVKEKKKKKRPQ
jgi:O-acetyl-ADP-ribose deacetylase (regulator of RNase III)